MSAQEAILANVLKIIEKGGLIGQIQSLSRLIFYLEICTHDREKASFPLFDFKWPDSLPNLLFKLRHPGPPPIILLGDVTTH